MDQTRLVLVCNNSGQWEDKTEEIGEFVADRVTKMVKVCYKSNPARWYSYRQERVRLLDATATLNPAEVQIRIGKRLLPQVDSIIQYPGYFLVRAPGYRRLFESSKVQLERNVADSPTGKNALDYFRSIAELISIKNEDGQTLLSGQYKYLSRVSDASVLAAYLTPGSALVKPRAPDVLIHPFGTNVSQMTAIKMAFQSQVTIVQGPPGTGKTQTILNIIANAIRLGQTVAVVSNNNAATKNVADKLRSNGLGFLLAELGSRANKDAFIETQKGYPTWLSQAAMSRDETSQLEANLESLTATLDRLARVNNDRVLLATQIAQIRAEADLHRRAVGGSPPSGIGTMLRRWKASDLLTLLVEIEEKGPNFRVGLLRILMDIFLYGLAAWNVRRQLVALGPTRLRGVYYEKYLSELQAQLGAIENILAENNIKTVQDKILTLSWKLLRATIAERIGKKDTRPVFAESDLWKKYASFLGDYPVVLSTTHSIKTSLSPECLYDLVIVDEASQVDVTTGVLALSCARRAVIVGDEKQLPNVISEETKQQAADKWNKHRPSCPAWNHAINSLLSSAMQRWPQTPNVLLREHYRCHPKIAGFFNRKFYSGSLIVMTPDRGESEVLKAVFTVPGNHARGRINQRQIDVISHEILPTLKQSGLIDIGVIAPYRDQVSRLRSALGDKIEVDTVHGFQGREKQAIVLSTVDNEIGDFVDDARLLNVAVSRAQRSLTVVMAEGQDCFTTNFGDLVRYIRHQRQSVMQSQVRSVFDLLYGAYANARQEYLNARGRGSVWDSENLAEAVIRDVLNRPEFSKMSLDCMRHVPLVWFGFTDGSVELSEQEHQFVSNPWSHVDLLIYDTIGKLPLVAIEVDGWAFHRPGSLQSVRDEIKNAVFQRAGLRLVRLSTTGSNEEAVVLRAVREAVGLTRP